MDPVKKLAKIIKKRDNKDNGFDNFILGTVVTGTPNPKIQIEEEIFIEQEDLIFNSTAAYEEGEKAVLIPSKNAEIYLVVGKAVQY